jgi:GNAT superfamily N-acetyltransferase
MSLKGVSATLSPDGTPLILLQKEKATVAELPIVRATSEHRNFILGTWVKSYRAQARDQGILAQYNEYEPAIAESRWMDCLVVTDDTGFTVHAWVCGRDGQLWHCYVVPELRRLRVATRLIEYACGPGGLHEYARPWPYSAHARVNPYLLRTKDDSNG